MSRSEDFCIRMPEGCSSISKSTWGKWLIEGIVFLSSLGGLIASLTANVSKNHVIWFLEPWKWCVLVMVIVGGRRIMQWMMELVAYFVKKVYLFIGVKVYYSYYIYSLGKCISVVLWFGSVLLTWLLLFKSREVKSFLNLANHEVKRSNLDSHIQKYITRSLGTLVIGGFLWVLKTLLVNMLSSQFQATRLFDRFRESLIDQYILEVFSEILHKHSVVVKWLNDNHLPCKGEETTPVINRLKKIEPEEISAWTVDELIRVITSNPLSPITQELEKLAKKELDMKQLFNKAEDVAVKIFGIFPKSISVGRKIEKGELQTLFEKVEKAGACAEEASYGVQHIIGTGLENDEIIGEQALKKWLVNATTERRSLAQSLNDTERAIEELNKLVSGILLALLFVLWLIMLGILTTEAFVAIMGQFVALAFIFGDTVKSVFQGIIFVFVKHPFDIGDCCLINDEELVVEKINLLSTVFRKNVMDKIMYPNSDLTTRHIKKLYNGNRHIIKDSFEIVIDLSTIKEPSQQIDSLHRAIIEFLDGRADQWLSSHSFKFKEIEDRKLKIVLSVSYRKRDLDSDWAVIIERRHALVEELMKFFPEEKEKIVCCNILPKAVDAEYIAAYSPKF